MDRPAAANPATAREVILEIVRNMREGLEPLHYSETAGVPRPKATQAVETIIDALRQALSRGERIELRGFGVFLVKPRKRGFGRNPKHPTEEVQIPPGFTIRFKPGKQLRGMTGPPEKPVAKAASRASA